MIHRNYIIAAVTTMIFSWTSLVVVVMRLSPRTQGTISLPLFYMSLFIALASTLMLVLYALRSWSSQKKVKNNHLNTSLREGILLSIMVNIGLIFQHLQILTWWDAILILSIILLIEFYFMSRK